MSANKDFLPSSSPVSSICAIEIIAILFLFVMNCYKSSFQECITIIVLKDDRTTNQPPCCLLQLQEKVSFHLPRSGCLGTPVSLPQSLYGRTDGRTLTSEPKFFGSTGYQIFLPMVLRELRYEYTQQLINAPPLKHTFLHLYSLSFVCTHFPSFVLTSLHLYSLTLTLVPYLWASMTFLPI